MGRGPSILSIENLRVEIHSHLKCTVNSLLEISLVLILPLTFPAPILRCINPIFIFFSIGSPLLRPYLFIFVDEILLARCSPFFFLQSLDSKGVNRLHGSLFIFLIIDSLIGCTFLPIILMVEFVIGFLIPAFDENSLGRLFFATCGILTSLGFQHRWLTTSKQALYHSRFFARIALFNVDDFFFTNQCILLHIEVTEGVWLFLSKKISPTGRLVKSDIRRGERDLSV